MRKGCLLILFVAVNNLVTGQISLTNISPSAFIDFSSATPIEAGTNPGSPYAAAGFEPNPGIAGRLNSNAWAVTGWSDGPLVFGGSNLIGDYARGTTSASVTTGGFYAYTGAPGSVANPALMIQPGGGDFSPGTLILRVQNNGTDIITQLSVSYNLFIRNDQGRSSSLNFSYSSDDVTYTPVPALDYTSPATADGLGWVMIGTAPSRATTISGLNIPPGSFVYIRWTGNDVGGSGSRDEFGLDDISMIATFTPLSTDYYRSATSGNWNNATTWETSPNNLPPWSPAILPPNYVAKNIYIQNGDTVSLTSSVVVDEVEIQNGGVLINNMASSNSLTILNGPGDDMLIKSGGIYQVTSGIGYDNYQSINAGGTFHIEPLGIIRIGTGGSLAGGNQNSFAITPTTYIWDSGSIFDWNTTSLPGATGVTFFPDATASIIPIWRFTKGPALEIGGAAPLFVNGLLEANASITLAGTGDRTFRNGIIGSGNVTINPGIGVLKVNGSSAVFGGPGSIIPNANGLSVGNNTMANMISGKSINGNLSVLSNSYIDLGTFNLSVSGICTGSATGYIKTTSTGSLILKNVTSLRNAPVGNATYNPVSIDNADGYDWSVNVEDVLTVDDPMYIPNITKAVQRTWNVIPSVNPPATGADIIFSWNDDPAAIPRQTGLSYDNSEVVQIWRKIPHIPPGPGWFYDWIAVGVTQIPGGIVNSYRTATINNWKLFSPFAISTFSGPLPVNLVDFNVIKISPAVAGISWQLAQCCSKDARFEIQKSTDNSNFVSFANITGSETNRFYSYNDTRLGKGITYYRLKMIDVDEKVSYSKIVVIVNETKNLFITSLSPNPVTSHATFTISSAKEEAINFSIYNAAGIVVKQWQQSLPGGIAVIHFDAGKLKAGVYYLSAVSTDNHSVITFVKQ